MLAYTFLMLQSLGQEIQGDPAAGGTFPPCTPTQPSGLPSVGTRPAVSGRGGVAD